jgi:His/Glu/Gln/Arg/opine family amino acid ABC transporter permease subunit
VQIDAVTLEGLNRHNLSAKVTTQGSTMHLGFEPVIKPNSVLRIQFNGVITPEAGGMLTVGGTYDTPAGAKPLPLLQTQQSPPSLSQKISFWLDKQPWVAAWNSVPILNGFFKPQLIVTSIPLAFLGWLLSIGIIAVAYPAAIPVGLLTAFAKMSKLAPLRWLASLYINVIRGTPLFLQLFVAFFGFPLIGIRIPDIPLAMGVLAFNSAAYMAEIFRAGIQSISKGQFEAASSLGMTYPQAMAFVIIPQTVKRVLPTMTSEFILLFKDTALLAAVGVFELMLYSNNLVARTGDITPFMVAAVFYLIITVPLINVVGRLEARLAQSEGGQAAAPPPSKRGRSWQPAAAGPVTSLEASSVEHESR